VLQLFKEMAHGFMDAGNELIHTTDACIGTCTTLPSLHLAPMASPHLQPPAWHAPLRVLGHLTRVELPETLIVMVHIVRSRYMFLIVVCGLEACR
jgi:hypothetical protein